MSVQPNQNQRPDGVTLIAIYYYLIALMFLFGTLIMALPTGILGIVGITEDPGAFIGMFAVGLIAMAIMALCLLHLVVGYGLWTMRPWSRMAAMAMAVVGLFAAPIGTIAGAVIIWYLIKPEVVELFDAQRNAT